MLTPRPQPVDQRFTISVRLSSAQSNKLMWLITHLNMNRSEIVQAMIDAEYEQQGGPVQ